MTKQKAIYKFYEQRNTSFIPGGQVLLRFSLFCLLAAITHTVMAQHLLSGLRGVVIDQQSEAPLPFATISLSGTDPLIGTTSNEAGEFELREVPIGRYDVQVSFLGYEPKVLNGVLISSGKVRHLEIGLTESVINLDEIVVRPKEEKAQPLNRMATVSARQLSMEEANKYAGGLDDPARLAASFAGVAGELEHNGIVIRGNAPRGLLWRLEGIEVPSPNHFGEITGFGVGGITALSSQMMANSDFLTGAFPGRVWQRAFGRFRPVYANRE